MANIYQTLRPIVSQAETLYNCFSWGQLQDKSVNMEYRLSVADEIEGKETQLSEIFVMVKIRGNRVNYAIETRKIGEGLASVYDADFDEEQWRSNRYIFNDLLYPELQSVIEEQISIAENEGLDLNFYDWGGWSVKSAKNE